MKKLPLILCIVFILGGCAHTNPNGIERNIVSPNDAVLFYMNSLATNDAENAYFVTSLKTKENIRFSTFKKEITAFDLFAGKDLRKSVILDINKYSATDSIVYLLFVLQLKFKKETESLIYKFHTHFEDHEWKVHIQYKGPKEIDFTPTFLSLNKKELSREDLTFIRSLIKSDMQKTTPKSSPIKQSSTPIEAQQPTTKMAIDPKLQIIQKCFSQGEQLYAEGQYREAIKQFQKVLSIDKEALNAKDYIQKCKKHLK